MTLSIQTTGLPLDASTRAIVETKLDDALRPLRGVDLAPLDIAVTLHQTTEGLGDVHARAVVTGAGTPYIAEGVTLSLDTAVVEMKHDLTRQVRERRDSERDAQRRADRLSSGRADS